MNKIDINIGLEMPDQMAPEYKQPSLLEKVQDYIFVCESDEDSEYHWFYLKCLYEKLKKCGKLKPEHVDVIMLLDNFFREHSGHADGPEHVDLEGVDFFKYKEER